MYFFTATISSWQQLLKDDEIKEIITNSLLYFHQNRRAIISGFVIMPNHIHILWSPLGEFTEAVNEFALLSFTAHEVKKHLLSKNNWAVLNNYRATQTDRKFHFWERRPRSIQVLSYEIAMQKLEYIHRNPCHEKWSLSAETISYKYSSASFYEKELDHFGFLTHISELI
jgi:REP element-mobilizing transposase RayT